MSGKLTPKVVSILRAMYPNFKKWYYTRELAKLAEVSSWTVSKRFSRLVKEGMVQQRVRGREKFYRANLSNAKTRKIFELFEAEKREKFFAGNRRLAWTLEDFTEKAADFIPEIQSVVLFGSVTRDEVALRSDIDVLVMVPNYEEERFKQLMDSIDNLAREVGGRYPSRLATVVMSVKDFEQSLRNNKRFAADVLRDGIVLFGEERYYNLLSKVV